MSTGAGSTDREFLVCHDYGMGGIWWWMTAPSAEAISEYYGDVTVFDGLPPWAVKQEQVAMFDDVRHVALGDEDAGSDRLRQRLRREALGG
jgi:hypothetical protein